MAEHIYCGHFGGETLYQIQPGRRATATQPFTQPRSVFNSHLGRCHKAAEPVIWLEENIISRALERSPPDIGAEEMVHADASNFADGITKEDAYEQVLLQAEGLFIGQRNWVCNLANAASLLWHAYKSLGSPSKDVNWAGFYVLDKSSQDPQLILGPFQGKVACQTIRVGKGVCGAAAESLETQLVEDVETFPGHIACDGDSKSEIVVPIVADQDDGSKKLVAIIDIDCAELNGFDGVDKLHLEQLAVLLAKSCDW